MSPTLVRVLSALAAVLLIGVGFTFFGNLGVLALGLLVVAKAQFEYGRMIFNSVPLSTSATSIFSLAALTVLIIGINTGTYSATLIGITSVAFLISLLIGPLREFETTEMRNLIGLSVFGLTYLGWLPSLALNPLIQPDGHLWFLHLLLVVFANDTFAYFIGKRFGKKKLWKKLSPKKTWAGSIGGNIGTLVATAGMFYFCFSHINPWIFFGLSLLGGICAQVGDLFESLVKRASGVKDSGSIMPGHGGALDRIDGLLFAAPFIKLIQIL